MKRTVLLSVAAVVLSSLVICFFARGIYTPAVVIKALRSAGLDVSEEMLGALGRETHKHKYAFKLREGFSLDKLRFPKRMLQTPAMGTGVSEDLMKEALKLFAHELHAENKA